MQRTRKTVPFLLFVNFPVPSTFNLDSAREPEGFAEVALKVSDYRKLEPSPLEELLFFDHPSGKTRIQMAMQWKAEHLE